MRYPQSGRAGAGAALLAAAVVLAACTGSPHSATPSPATPGAAKVSQAAPSDNGVASLPPAQMLSQALAAARAAGSVHVSLAATAGRLAATITTDATLTEGRSVINSIDGGQATVIVVNGTGYVNANAAAWTYYFEKPSVASRLAGKWVTFTASSSDYQQITADVTLDSAISAYTLASPITTSGRSTQGGRPVIGVVGTMPSSAGAPLAGSTGTLYVATTGQPLPVAYQVSTSTAQVGGTFSKWGEPVSITAPANAIPF